MFYRLISSILALSDSNENGNGNGNKSESKMTDFRFILFHILQRQIWEMIRKAGPDKVNDENLFYNNVVPDMGRAVGWTGYLSREAQIESTKTNFNPDKRPVLF